MYRENKYGEKVDVNKYECGSCKFYLFEKEDETNKCTHYGRYYDCNDRCNYWEESNETSGGGCFLTTACCQYKGLPDNCYELETLRKFRDEVLKENEEGKQLVKEYYRIAPGLVQKIEAMPDKERTEILENIYQKILQVLNKIKSGDNEGAIARYYSMVCWVESKVV